MTSKKWTTSRPSTFSFFSIKLNRVILAKRARVRRDDENG